MAQSTFFMTGAARMTGFYTVRQLLDTTHAVDVLAHRALQHGQEITIDAITVSSLARTTLWLRSDAVSRSRSRNS